jgi:hypothetical protein
MATTNSGSVKYTQERAIGARGFLIRGAEDQVWFRVYDKNHDFVDYEITNYDCEVVIIDPDAAFHRGEHGDFLDYTDESMRPAK